MVVTPPTSAILLSTSMIPSHVAYIDLIQASGRTGFHRGFGVIGCSIRNGISQYQYCARAPVFKCSQCSRIILTLSHLNLVGCRILLGRKLLSSARLRFMLHIQVRGLINPSSPYYNATRIGLAVRLKYETGRLL